MCQLFIKTNASLNPNRPGVPESCKSCRSPVQEVVCLGSASRPQDYSLTLLGKILVVEPKHVGGRTICLALRCGAGICFASISSLGSPSTLSSKGLGSRVGEYPKASNPE